MASSTSLIHELLAMGSDKALIDALHSDVEGGGFFNAVGLHGFVEEAIFSWYLDATTTTTIGTSLCLAICTLLAQLSVYRFDTIQKTDRSRDVLRDFFTRTWCRRSCVKAGCRLGGRLVSRADTGHADKHSLGL